MTHVPLTAIAGGIGSGKSVVSKCLRIMGYEVYDTDTEAKRIMDTSRGIKRAIAVEICREAITDTGDIDRRRLARAVFADSKLLGRLNVLVHRAVVDDIKMWYDTRSEAGIPLFVETALLYQSRIDTMVDCVWLVDAPVETRVGRIVGRGGISDTEARSRIDAQERYRPDRRHAMTRLIVNDGRTALLPRIGELLSELTRCHASVSEPSS